DGPRVARARRGVGYGGGARGPPGQRGRAGPVPVTRQPAGGPIRGPRRAELPTPQPATTLNLSSGWFTGLTHRSYPTASTDNRTPFADRFLPALTVRAREQEPRVRIPNTEWTFGACAAGGATAPDTQICYPAGFQPGRF